MIAVRGWVVVVLVVATGLAGADAAAQMFQTVEPQQAQLVQTGAGRLYCPGCGMNLVKFYKTSHAVPAADGPARHYCSLHCLVEAHAEMPPEVLVADAQTLALVPAERAHYVVGSDLGGTMTMTSKYAFADRDDAEEFQAVHGGRILTFAEAVDVARKGLAAEQEMVAGKRTKMAQKGRRVFEATCAGRDVPSFDSLFTAKTWAAGQEACAALKDDQLQALAIYLVQRGEAGAAAGTAGQIQVPEKAKCPVCGMFAAKYPHWVAVVREAGGAEYFFDGVKDLMKCRFEPARFGLAPDGIDHAQIQVTDYYSLTAIDARAAWYVVGSNVFGPMGNELIPFAALRDAEAFLADHSAQRILEFTEITRDLVYGLDQ